MSIKRATFGASPRAAMSYNTFAFVPSNNDADDVTGSIFEIEDVVEGVAVLAQQVRTVVVWRATEQRRDRGGNVDELGRAWHEAEVADALAAEHERRPGLHDAERAVLAEMAALVFPVVCGGVQHAEIGRGRRRRRAGRSARTRTGRRCRPGGGRAAPARRRAGVNLSVDWSARGSRPSTVDPFVEPSPLRRNGTEPVVGGAS